MGQWVREMGEVFCSHYVQVSQWVREMGDNNILKQQTIGPSALIFHICILCENVRGQNSAGPRNYE